MAPPGQAAGGTFTQTSGILFNDNGLGTAVPYPSNNQVSGLPKGITDVNVSLFSWDTDFSQDTDVLLVGPAGQSVTILSDVFNGVVSGLNLTFDDQAASSVPSPPTNGTFKPTDGAPVGEVFPAPAPGAPTATTLAAFNGTDPNGTWQLFVVDDIDDGDGPARDFSGGWSLQITTVDIPAAPVFTTPAANPSTDRDGDFILAGTAQAGSTVKVFEGATQVGTATASGGSWAVALVDVPHGTHTYTATATDSFGNTSALSTARTVRVDTIHPRVIRVRPTNGADEVRQGANIRAWFSEDMRPGTITRATVRLVEAQSGDRVRARVTYDPVIRKVTLNPRGDLAADTRYKAVIGTGVRDLAGNALDQKLRTGNQPKVWRFTTR